MVQGKPISFGLIPGFLLLGAALPASAGEFYGMLRTRDLTPFGFLRLDMRPAHALDIEPGKLALEVELGYQNTWALSETTEKYLKSLEGTGPRRRVDEDLIQEIRDLPGENYLLDLESATVDFALHYKIGSNWSAYAIASVVSYHGGFLDSTIEKFHDTFGFSTFGRHALRRNRTNFIYDLDTSSVAMVDPPQAQGMLDPTFGVRYSGFPRVKGWDFSVEAAIKVALDGERLLLSTGHDDVGLQVSMRRLGNKNAFHLDVSGVYYAGQNAPQQDKQIIPTIVFAWERVLTDRTNLNLQAYASQSVYSRKQTHLNELLEDKFQLSLGVRHRFEHGVMSFAVTENLQNFNNTPDVGFQLGFALVPFRIRREP